MHDLVDRVRREIVLARFVGKLAVDQGLREARAHLDDLLATLAGPGDAEPTPSAEATPPFATDDDAATTAKQAGEQQEAAMVVAVDDLALADYDQLPAAHVIAKLDDLEPDERDAIEAYESAGRHRRTILTKLARLREDLA